MNINVYKCTQIKLLLEHLSGVQDIALNTRKRHIVEYRKFYFNLCKLFTKASLAKIGAIVRKDHATVLHGIKSLNIDIPLNQVINIDVYNEAFRKLEIEAKKEAIEQSQLKLITSEEIPQINVNTLLNIVRKCNGIIKNNKK